jgi:predicted nucleic acid-binding protein
VEVKRYVDVNVFVYWLGGNPVYGEKAHQWVKKIEGASKGEYATSTLTLYEAVTIITGLIGGSSKDASLANNVVEPISNLKGLNLVPLTSDDMLRSVELMNEYGLDYEDSLHLAAALSIGSKEIVSNDKDFDKVGIKRLF